MYCCVVLIGAFLALLTQSEFATAGCTTGKWKCSGNNRQQCANNIWYTFKCPSRYTCTGGHNCVPDSSGGGGGNEGGGNEGGGNEGGGNEGGGNEGGGNGGGGSKPDLKGALASRSEFDAAVQSCGYSKPTTEQYNNCVGLAKKDGDISTKRELAMFLTEILWESGGLKYKEEIACKDTKCPGSYRAGGEPPGKYYYGRGYIQLSWIYNYKACSKALFGTESKLVNNPDLVASDDSIAWGSAFWFWKANVHNDAGVQKGQFGSATRKINGGLECDGAYKHKARKRFACYQKVFKAFNLSGQPIERGCYN